MNPSDDEHDDTRPLVVSDIGSGVRLLALNRPHAHNALTTELIAAFKETMASANSDDAVRAIVITGRGKSFCAGGDTKEFDHSAQPRADMIHRASQLSSLQDDIRSSQKPVVAAARGAVLGGGAAIALAADFMIAGADLKLGFPEITSGVIPAAVAAASRRAFAPRLALETLMTGRVLSGEEALVAGAANRVVATELTDEVAITFATDLATLNPESVQATKQLFHRIGGVPFAEALAIGMEVTAKTWRPAGERDRTSNTHDEKR